MKELALHMLSVFFYTYGALLVIHFAVLWACANRRNDEIGEDKDD